MRIFQIILLVIICAGVVFLCYGEYERQQAEVAMIKQKEREKASAEWQARIQAKTDKELADFKKKMADSEAQLEADRLESQRKQQRLLEKYELEDLQLKYQIAVLEGKEQNELAANTNGLEGKQSIQQKYEKLKWALTHKDQ